MASILPTKSSVFEIGGVSTVTVPTGTVAAAPCWDCAGVATAQIKRAAQNVTRILILLHRAEKADALLDYRIGDTTPIRAMYRVHCVTACHAANTPCHCSLAG